MVVPGLSECPYRLLSLQKQSRVYFNVTLPPKNVYYPNTCHVGKHVIDGASGIGSITEWTVEFLILERHFGGIEFTMLITKNLCSGVKNKNLGLEARELVENKSLIFKQLRSTMSLL